MAADRTTSVETTAGWRWLGRTRALRAVLRGLLLLSGCGLLLACSAVVPVGQRLFHAPAPALEGIEGASPGPLSAAWAIRPEHFERLLLEPPQITSVEAIEQGAYGVRRLTVRLPSALSAGLDGRSRVGQVSLKFKPSRPRIDAINNSPRKSIAAHHLQRLLFEPHEYVLPVTGISCIPLGHAGSATEATLEGSQCTLGTVSAWLEGLVRPNAKIDVDRFLSDPAYASHVAHLNLLLVLADHSDSHKDNLLESSLDGSRPLFSIDNDLTFGSPFRNPFISDWNRLRAPALRRASIETLRALRRGDLDALGVVAQLELGAEGIYRAAVRGENLDPDAPVRRAGRILQLGLTTREIDGVWARRNRLLRAVDRGRIPLF